MSDLSRDLGLLSRELGFSECAVSAPIACLTDALPRRGVALTGETTATDVGRDVLILEEIDVREKSVLALSIHNEDELNLNSERSNSSDLIDGD